MINVRRGIFWDICAPAVQFRALILWKLQVLYYTLNSSGDPVSEGDVVLLFHSSLNTSCNSTDNFFFFAAFLTMHLLLLFNWAWSIRSKCTAAKRFIVLPLF